MRSIRTIAYDFGTFVIISIFESVILVYPKHSNLRVFFKSNSRRNHANQKHPKICECFGKTKNENSWSLMRLYSERNYVFKLRDKLFEDEDLKWWKIGETEPIKQYHAPKAHVMCLEHGKKLFMFLEHITMRLEHGFGCTLMCPEHLKYKGRKRNFILFVDKSRDFDPNLVRNSH